MVKELNPEFIPPEGFQLDDIFNASRKKRRIKDKRPKTWMENKNRYRKNKCASLSWKIKEFSRHNRMILPYETHDILPGGREWPDLECEGRSFWADIYFLSEKFRHKGILWNATVTSPAMRACEEINELAENSVKKLLTKEEQEIDDFKVYSRKKSNGYTEMLFSPKRRYESLDGLTIDSAKSQWIRERWHKIESLIDICPKAEIDREYQYGIGLHIITPAEFCLIDHRTLPMIVNQFIERGEIDYVDKPTDLSICSKMLRGLIEVELYYSDCTQAKAENKDKPKPNETVRQLCQYKSQGIMLISIKYYYDKSNFI